MSREQDLLAAFIEFADTFVADYDVVEFLHRLAERCVELINASEVGIMLADREGVLHYVASSSELMRVIELVELQHDEGPCLDAYRTGLAVHSESTGDAIARWPRVARHARDLGFQAMAALPMRLRSEVIGALNVFSTTPEPLSSRDRQLAQALADIATIGILQERAIHDSRAFSAQLEAALDSRIVIEQAKGIVAERNQVDVDVAFQQIRRFARNHNRLLSNTAREIIAGALTPLALTRTESRQKTR